MTFPSNLLTLAGVQMHSVQQRRRWGWGSPERASFVKYLQWAEADVKVHGGIGDRVCQWRRGIHEEWPGWFIRCYCILMPAGDFSSPNPPGCFLKTFRPWASRMPWGRELHDSLLCKEIAPTILSPPPISSAGWSLLERAVSSVWHLIAGPRNLGCGGPMWQSTCLCGMS